jgi:hypothetical protein
MKVSPIKPPLFFSAIISLMLFSLCNKSIKAEAINVFDYAHFTFHTQSLTKSDLDSVNQKLEDEFDRILRHHGLDSIRRVNFYIFNNVTSLREELRKKIPDMFVPDFATGLTPSATDIYLVIPPSGRYTIYIHEFVHCVTQHLNPTIPNRPRWLWESVALYEANELIAPENISAITSNKIPSISELNDFNNTLIYQIGYLLGEFIFKNFGKEKYIQLIKGNGNINKVLGLTDEAFLNKWYQYVKLIYKL